MGGSRKGAGRKPGPEEQLRRHRVTVFLTDEEMLKLTVAASRKDVPLGAAAYEIVARALRRQKLPPSP